MAILDKIKENRCNANDISCGRPDEAFMMGRDLTFGETLQKMKKPIVISSVMTKYRSESTRRQIENNAEDIVSKLLSIPKIISTSSIFLYEYEKNIHYGCHITIDIESCKTGYEASRVLFSIISILSCALSAFSIHFNIILDKSSETWRINPDSEIINTSLFREQITESPDLIRLFEYMSDRTLSNPEYERCVGRLLNSFDRIINR